MKLFTKFLFIFCFILVNHSAARGIDGKKKIFFEYQTKEVKTQEIAKDLGEDWSPAKIQQLYGSIGFDLNLWSHHIHMNTYLRHAQSSLFEKDSPSLAFSSYPQSVIARDVFRLEHKEQTDHSRSQAVLNHFTYDWGDDEITFTAGRMHIVYGEGLIINPINPFNHNSSLANSYGIDQSNDGFSFQLNKDPKLKLHFYFLGDKSYTDYDEDITRTIFMRGDWEVSKKTQVQYILGQDQNRHKYGVEIKTASHYGIGFMQLVRFSQKLDSESADAEGLFHYLFGYEIDLSNVWTTRLEFGKFEAVEGSTAELSTNYLPYESIIGLNNLFRINDNWNTELMMAHDSKSKSSFYKFSTSYDIDEAFTARIFASGTFSEALEEAEYLTRHYIPSEIGLAIRANF